MEMKTSAQNEQWENQINEREQHDRTQMRRNWERQSETNSKEKKPSSDFQMMKDYLSFLRFWIWYELIKKAKWNPH